MDGLQEQSTMAMTAMTVDEEAAKPGRKGNGFYCSPAQLFFVAITVAITITGVGLLCYYAPDRPECSGTDPIVGLTTKNVPTEKPKTEKPQTEKPKTEKPVTTKMMTTKKATDAPPTAPQPTSGEWEGRLPSTVKPTLYTLSLRPYMYEKDIPANSGKRLFSFDGTVKIEIDCLEKTSTIKLHMNAINLTAEPVVTDIADSKILSSTYTTQEDYQFLVINLDSGSLLPDRKYEISLEYVGDLWNGLAGFYRSKYVNEAGEERYIATTQMQPTDARRALPCFDEPAFKAKFDTTIIHPNDLTAITNMPNITTEALSGNWIGWTKTTFDTTPPMSTYLLAFIVSDFEYKEGKTSRNVTFRVWARKERINTVDYALDCGIKILEFFEDYFDIAYPLPKQDMIAIPDFSAGAMENWGLITYRETALLFDENENSASNQQRVAVVISHELAHQWFGNLVTPIWWDDLWLNEGFASYVEYLGVDHIHPGWLMKEQFVVADLEYVFTLDGLGSSHPIKVPVRTPEEISEIFDSISYSKGASILRMLNDILTEDVFVRGLTNYLNHYKYSNAESDDLWEFLTSADRGYGDNDVKRIMDTWTLQMGYPVVNCTRTDNEVFANQTHFLIDPTSEVEDKYGDQGYQWYVDVSHSNADSKSWSHMWLNKGPGTIKLSGSPASDDWYILNRKQSGYYRVNYDGDNWEALKSQLEANSSAFPDENQAALIDDAFNLARAGLLDQVTALGLTTFLKNELSYLPWEATLTVMGYVQDMFSRYEGYGALETYMRDLTLNLYNSVGWNDTGTHLEQYNRINALSTACAYKNDDCLLEARRLYTEYMTSSNAGNEMNPVSPNLRSLTYCNGIREGGQEEWDFGWEKYLSTDDSSEKSKWLYALGCSQEPWILSRYLEFSLDQSKVRSQDATYVIEYVSDNYVGRALAWDFLRAKWETFRNDYGGGSFSFSRLISSVTKHFNTEFDLAELEAFGIDRDFGSAARAYEQSIEKTKANIIWMNNNAQPTFDWLKAQNP
ncbi:aminopeptidase N-like isoform X2 [Anneissia japonica]|uniref:aminopeptidase N-like isoform X2 n=1 Tax=Anneissia japonica TaxID=1529436 RepID=UPI001425B874|nr:aminopeptidase N-like isoform X2 [Anneissia japonica]